MREKQKSGRPKGLSNRIAQERRASCYELYSKGFTEVQIASSLGFSQSSVSRYLTRAQREKAESSERFGGLFKLLVDRIGQLLEHWPEDRAEPQPTILSRVLDLLSFECRVLGFIGGELTDLVYFKKVFQRLERKSDGIKRRTEEQGMVSRVLS